MMDASQIAQLFDDLKPAFSLVDFEEVGLPVYRLTATILTLEPKAYAPIEEFVLKCIDAGMTTASDISGLLGIDLRIVEGCLTNLIRDDDVIASGEGVLSLTRQSRLVLSGEQAIKPREQAAVFTYDALVRRPRYFGAGLLRSHDIKNAGYREIRAMPARKPEAGEVNVRDLEEALEMEVGTKRNEIKILRVREIGRKENRFIPAVMLVYKATTGAEVRVRFAVDGRLSTEHERAFLSAGGLEKLGVRESVLASQPSPPLSELIGLELASVVTSNPTTEDESLRLKRKASIARFKAEMARRSQPVEDGTDVQSPTYTAAVAEASGAERELATLKVRPIAVYEHPPLLEEALEKAQDRILIVSPWIVPEVVDARFLKRLQAALERSVEVRIGYGLASRGQGRPNPNAAERALHELAQRHANLKVVWLGNTHAKILLKDSEWFVVSSFNWLSFRGDSKRTFREEWGTFVGVSSVVDRYYAKISLRLDTATDQS